MKTSLVGKKCYAASITIRLTALLILVYYTGVILMWQYSKNAVEKRSAVLPSLCLPRNDIVFLKTHKCASSTIQNILFRYGEARNLNFVLPVMGHYLGIIPFNRRFVVDAPWDPIRYNIFCHHAVFNSVEIASIMPPEAVYVSILRHPVSLFESLYSYANLDKLYRVDLDAFTRKVTKDGYRVNRALGHLGRNQMLFDLGMNPELFDNSTAINDTIRSIEEKFDLIMIAEYFDESLILLKDLMCWQMDDIVYLKLNARKKNERKPIGEETRRALMEYNSADATLYGHFLGIFMRKIKDFGEEEMKRQVRQLRSLIKSYKNDCVFQNESGNFKEKSWFKPWSNKVLGYELKNRNRTCQNLIKPEISFTEELKMRQMARSLRNSFQRKKLKLTKFSMFQPFYSPAPVYKPRVISR